MKKLTPGPELNALVAEKVLGFYWEEWETGRGLYAPGGVKVAKRFKSEGMALQICDINGSECVPTLPLPRYSTDICAAWEILNHPVSEKWDFKVELTISRGAPDDTKLYTVRISDQGGVDVSATEPSAALAICKAALLAVAAVEAKDA